MSPLAALVRHVDAGGVAVKGSRKWIITGYLLPTTSPPAIGDEKTSHAAVLRGLSRAPVRNPTPLAVPDLFMHLKKKRLVDEPSFANSRRPSSNSYQMYRR